MDFIAHPEIFERFPGMRLAIAVAFGLDNAGPRAGVDAEWQAAWEGAAALAAPYPNPQSHPLVVPWREGFKAMGISVKEFRSSIEALLRRAVRGGEPFRINPLVDFYNAISLRHVVPAGGFDLGTIERPLELRLTRPGDTFLALDSPDDTPLELPAGEIAYAAGSTILTRHFVWRQARAGVLAPTTRDIFLVSEVPLEADLPIAEAVRDEFVAGLHRHFSVPAQGFIVDETRREISWEW